MSSSDIAISVRGLSKAYTIAHEQEKHSTLAETLLHKARNLEFAFRRSAKETFWALKDLDFEVKKGEVVGIIGRNGAGKSTLLKILSRITEPTTGQIDLYGRIGSLLEVGTGFHPELTGRENVYLNGAILGMRRREIDAQFDAIVDFSGVEKFLDTPVKRYSSGMYVRLAFAVAAHLKTEILIVDEVLAVGDGEFQRRCLGKMQDVARDGRTVLVVSHNLNTVAALCGQAMFLQAGSLAGFGPVAAVLNEYQRCRHGKSAGAERALQGSRSVIQRAIPAKSFFGTAESKELRIDLRWSEAAPRDYFLAFVVKDEMGVEVCHGDSRLMADSFSPSTGNHLRLMLRTPWLRPGDYSVDLAICTECSVVDRFEDACELRVVEPLPYPLASTFRPRTAALADFAVTQETVSE